jgi:hypothetical protein
LEVDPAHLRAAAARCDRAAEGVDGVLRSVRAAGAPDPGRADTAAELDHLLDRLTAALTGLGSALASDADALVGAAEQYASTDRGAAGG